jgi:hypothetical protein
VVTSPHAGIVTVTRSAERDDLTPMEYADYLRILMRDRILARHALLGGFFALPLSATAAARLSTVSSDPLTTAECKRLGDAVEAALGRGPRGAPRGLMLVPYLVRRLLSQILRPEFPHVAILCDEEVPDALIVVRYEALEMAG